LNSDGFIESLGGNWGRSMKWKKAALSKLKGANQMRKLDPRELIANSGLFKQDSFDWILEIILNNKKASSGVIDLMVRTSGELMSGDEKNNSGYGQTQRLAKNISILYRIKVKKAYWVLPSQ